MVQCCTSAMSKRLRMRRRPIEKVTDHIEMRVRPSDKERISRAAELSGVKLAAFVRASADREAGPVLREHQATALSERDRRMLLEALDNPPLPTARYALRSYRARIVNTG